MTKIKQPDGLRTTALDNMVKFLTSSCKEVKSEERLRRWIAHIKEDIGPYIPGDLAPEFYDRFLTEFVRPDVNSFHQSLALEVIMDKKIVGLKCTHRDSLQTLELKDAHRIQGLVELNLNYMPHGLIGFRLQDLTKLTYQEFCIDSDLKIIGENCFKLEFLDISKSKKITEEGLRTCIALSLYPKLIVVKVSECCEISHRFIDDFLSAHDSIEELYAWHESANPGFDCFSSPEASVHRSIKSFHITSATVSNRELRTVIKKFPNLTELGIGSKTLDAAIDWSMLRFFKQLKKLHISVDRGFSWGNIKPVLRFIGNEIVSLHTRCALFGPSSCAKQTDLDFLYEFCRNIEVLEIDCSGRPYGEPLLVPSFAKLKQLNITTPVNRRHRPPPLQCGIMEKLEILKIERFAYRRTLLESLILDHVRLPNFRQLSCTVYIAEPSRDHEVDVINDLIKVNNLDLQFTLLPIPLKYHDRDITVQLGNVRQIYRIPLVFR